MAAITTGLLFFLLLLVGLAARRLARELRLRQSWLDELRASWSRGPRGQEQAGEIVSETASRIGAANRVLDEFQGIYPLHIVFGAPKTGCSTLSASVGDLDFCSSLHTAHYLSAAGVDRLQARAYAMTDPLRRPRLLRHARECRALDGILQARRLYAQRMDLGGHPFAKPWVITSVREPVAMALSSFFFSQGHLLKGEEKPSGSVSPGDFGGWLAAQRESLVLERWLEEELGGVFGIDPFAQRFPVEKGWLCGENESARFLLMRLESFDHLPDALGEFYGIPPESVRVVSENRARDRDDHTRYAELQGGLRLPREKLEQLYASRYVRHFYSGDEIDAFRARWEQTGP